MRIEHILISGLVALAILIVMSSSSVQFLKDSGLSMEQIKNNTNLSSVNTILSMNYFNQQTNLIGNESKTVPGQDMSQVPDTTASNAGFNPLSFQGFTSVLTFAGQATTLPYKIIIDTANFIGIPYVFTVALLWGLSLTIAFILISAFLYRLL